MALDASWWLNDATAGLAGASIERDLFDSDPIMLGSHDDTERPARRSLFKRAARFAVRLQCALQLRWYRIVYRMTLDQVGQGCVFGCGMLVQGHDRIRLGRDVRINDQVFLQCGGDSQLIIGDDVTISIGAKIMTGQYPIGPAGHDRSTHVYDTIVIEDGVWIGTGAVILPGVRIGRGSIVAAGSVVSRDVPPGVLVTGAPARPARLLSKPAFPIPITKHESVGLDMVRGAA